MEELQLYIDMARESMEKSISHLENELASVRAGRANPSLLRNINVEAYGAMMPLNQTANVSTPDARTIMIKPWDKAMLPEIEKAIMQSNIGLNPQNDGEQIRLNIPPLTEERRKDLVKQIKGLGEQAKISIRNARRDAIDGIKKTGKESSVSEDSLKDLENEVQTITDNFGKKVDEYVAGKEKEIMTV
ncbi:MAG: ribosome recycling factor [Saprospiraceae bacterium]|nr:ribosome recycling factor [Saprospiraceae bacterium]